jgi:hypothetical protein
MSNMTCEVPGCGRRKRGWTTRFCVAHLRRSQRHDGEPGPGAIRRYQRRAEEAAVITR